jgi:hypothetical protein
VAVGAWALHPDADAMSITAATNEPSAGAIHRRIASSPGAWR